jgi:hypothetical protein
VTIDAVGRFRLALTAPALDAEGSFLGAARGGEAGHLLQAQPLRAALRHFGFRFHRLPWMLRLADPWDSQGGAAMKRINVPRRPGHELDADADDCLVYVSWAGIPAHMGRVERGHNIIWVEDADVERAGVILRAHGFDC